MTRVSSIAAKLEARTTLITPAELADTLAVSVKSIYAWVANGTMPSITLGSSIRFDPAITADWLRRRYSTSPEH